MRSNSTAISKPGLKAQLQTVPLARTRANDKRQRERIDTPLSPTGRESEKSKDFPTRATCIGKHTS